jgi:hypothetical protein
MTETTYHMHVDTWSRWLALADRKEVCMYRVGPSTFDGGLPKPDVSRRAWEAACAGQVYLLQRRSTHLNGVEHYEYIAVRASHMRRDMVAANLPLDVKPRPKHRRKPKKIREPVTPGLVDA